MSDSKKLGGTNARKDVLYIDIDDEITAIIDSVGKASKKIVALVLPKRATVLQSAVNIKLLKKAADKDKKTLVLIGTDPSLLPLAGSVGIYVAKSLNSKPEIPESPANSGSVPQASQDEPEVANLEVNDSEDLPIDKTKTLGELSDDETDYDKDEDETIDLDNEEEDEEEPGKDKERPKQKDKSKKFSIPNFNKFRLWLIIGVAVLVVLVAGGYSAAVVLPKATVLIKTDSMAVASSSAVKLKTNTDELAEAEKGVILAQTQEVKKTLTQQVPTTGQQNNGEKSKGEVVLSLTDCAKPTVTIAAGTGLNASGKVFITQDSVTLVSTIKAGKCKNDNDASANVDVVAQTGGSGNNIGPSTFTVAGSSNVTGQSSTAMSGGTDNIIKVVTQADIDSAAQKIEEQDSEPVKQELKSSLVGRNLFAVESTFGVGAPETQTSAGVSSPADSVTVTQMITYTMLGVEESDLEDFIEEQVKEKVDLTRQSILDFGLKEATFGIDSRNDQEVAITLNTTVVAGAELDESLIKKQVAGKKAGDAKEIISDNPGVTDVTVNYSPFWVGSIPKKVNKITVVIQKPEVSKNDSTQSSP